MSGNKELWNKAMDEIDDKYIEEAARTIMKKSGNVIEMNSVNTVEISTAKSVPPKKESRLSRTLPVVLASAAALTIVMGAGHILTKYGFSMTSTHDGEPPTTSLSEDNEITSVNDELSRLTWGMSLEEVRAQLTFKPSTTYNNTQESIIEYINTELMGYEAVLDIHVSNTEGLCRIAYHISGGENPSLFAELSEKLSYCGGTADPVNDTLIHWHYDSFGYSVTLINTGDEVEYRIVPLIPENERYYTLQADSRPEYSAENIECEPVDMSLDHEAIVLEKSEELHRLMYNYLHYNEEKLNFELGAACTDEGVYDTCLVISDEMETYEDFKKLFSDSVYSEYFDYINTDTPALMDINGKLYRSDSMGGYLGTFETWYIGCDVEEDRIIGHFAELNGIENIGLDDAEYLNDPDNYRFYDIVIQNVGGSYVITDCRGITEGHDYDYYQCHGYFYNSGKADRSLVTNESFKPVFEADKIADYTAEVNFEHESGYVVLTLKKDGVIVDELQTYTSTRALDISQVEFKRLSLKSGDVLYLSFPTDAGEFGNSIVYLYTCTRDGIAEMKTNIGMEFETVMMNPCIEADPSYDYLYLYNEGEEKTAYQINFDYNTAVEARLAETDDGLVINMNNVEKALGDYTVRLNFDTDSGFSELVLINNSDRTEKLYDTGFTVTKIGNEYPQINCAATAGGKVLYITVPYLKADGSVGDNIYLYCFTDGEIYMLGNKDVSHVSFADENRAGMDCVYNSDMIYTNLTAGKQRTYYHINYDEHTALEMYYIPEMDDNTQPLNYSQLVFTETENNVSHAVEGTWEVILGGNWCSEGFKLSLYADMYAETDEAWFFRNINGLSTGNNNIVSMIMKDNTDIMYVYTDPDKTENLLLCNYSYAFTRADYDSTGEYTTYLNDFILVMQSRDGQPIKLIVKDADYSIKAEYTTDIYQNEAGEAVTQNSTVTFGDNVLCVISVPEINEDGIVYRNHFFKITDSLITPFTDLNNNNYSNITKNTGKEVFYDQCCYASAEDLKTTGDEKTYFCFDFDNATVTEKQLFPADSDTSLVNYGKLSFTQVENEESDPFIGRWDFPYEMISDTPLVISKSGYIAQTDKAWYRAVYSGGKHTLCCIFKDNPDYMYAYSSYTSASMVHADYFAVYKRTDLENLTEELAEAYVTGSNQYTVQLGYIQGLTTKLTRLMIYRNNAVQAELALDIEYDYSGSYQPSLSVAELEGGEVAVLCIPSGENDTQIRMFHCHSDSQSGFIKELSAYDSDGNAKQIIYGTYDGFEYGTDNISFRLTEQSSDGNVIYGTEYENYVIDFEKGTARQSYLYPVEADTSAMPDFSEASWNTEIIEKVFYGEWTLAYDAERDDVNPGQTRKIYNPMVFSYVGNMEYYPNCSLADTVYEDEKGWYAIGRNYQAVSICFVPKDDPDTLYYYYPEDTGKCTMNQFAMVYKRSENTSAVDNITAPAALTALGVNKLAELTGYDIFNPPESVSYDKSKKWVIGEVGSIGIGEVFITSVSENKIIYCRRACPADTEDMIYQDGYVFPTPNYEAFVYLTFTAEKINGEWKISSVAAEHSSKLHGLIYDLQKSNTGLYDVIIGYILNNYLSDEFWDESLSPEKQRITANAIRKLDEYIAEETKNNKELAELILNDSELLYTMCFNTYWQ